MPASSPIRRGGGSPTWGDSLFAGWCDVGVRGRCEAPSLVGAMDLLVGAGGCSARSVSGERFVGVAIHPAFTRLSRGDDRVAGRAVVSRRMLAGRGITAMRRPTRLAGAQVHPPAPNLHAL